MKKGTVYFFTGLAGAGKTTIGGLFYQRLKARKPNVFCADGDAMDGVIERSGYSTASRKREAGQLFHFCRALTEHVSSTARRFLRRLPGLMTWRSS